MTHTATVEFADVAALWHKLAARSNHGLAAKHAGGIADLTSSSLNGGTFAGDSIEGMRDKLANGYSVPGQKIHGKNTRDRRRLRYSEDDGDLEYGRILAGDDAIYVKRSPRKRQRGIKLEVELGFRGGVPPSVIADYAVWLGELISGLEGGGFQTQIDVASRCTNAVRGARLDALIRVKRFGQRGSMKSWSALLSPGGFRHLVFTARLLAADKAGQACKSMGGSIHPSWDLSWDPKDRKLTVRCNSNAGSFPAADMSAKLAAIKF
jgi:hypothetical protein